jgi:hypothetical protein
MEMLGFVEVNCVPPPVCWVFHFRVHSLPWAGIERFRWPKVKAIEFVRFDLKFIRGLLFGI